MKQLSTKFLKQTKHTGAVKKKNSLELHLGKTSVAENLDWRTNVQREPLIISY